MLSKFIGLAYSLSDPLLTSMTSLSKNVIGRTGTKSVLCFLWQGGVGIWTSGDEEAWEELGTCAGSHLIILIDGVNSSKPWLRERERLRLPFLSGTETGGPKIRIWLYLLVRAGTEGLSVLRWFGIRCGTCRRWVSKRTCFCSEAPMGGLGGGFPGGEPLNCELR